MEPKENSASAEPTTTQASTQTQENTSGTTTTQEGTPQTTSTSSGIIEEALSTEEPVEGAPATTAAEGEGNTTVDPSLPEPYELELDEDSPLTDEEFDEIVLEAERLKLNKEDAERLIKMREYSHKASQEVYTKLQQDKVEQMRQAYNSSEDLHTVEAKLSIREAVKAFGSDVAFQELFKDPAMNFNVPLARFLVSVGQKIRGAQNNLEVGKGSSIEGEGKTDSITHLANRMYKDM